MGKVFTSQQFIDKLKWLVSLPTQYSNEYWSVFRNGKWQFDCIRSIKAILWGFKGDKNKAKGGTVYKSNGVADFTCDGALNYCTDVSTNFSNLAVGEYLCMKGLKDSKGKAISHAGIYLGNGKVFECTTGWGVRRCIISDISKDGTRSLNGVKNLRWTYHGKLIYIDYETPPKPEPVNQVKLWQETMNKQFNCHLAVDGSFGPDSTAKANKYQLYYGVKAPIMVKWLQHRLNELGYKLAEDGSFGPLTKQAVLNFQKSRGLKKVNAYVGPETYKALTK